MLAKLIRSPALYMVLVGALAVGLEQTVFDRAEAPARSPLIISMSKIQEMQKELTGSSGRELTAVDKEGVIAMLLEEETLYQYAIDIGLDSTDVAQRRLARIASFVNENPHEVAQDKISVTTIETALPC